jgi:HTH-type transcriptional regulator/antitoxin HigA
MRTIKAIRTEAGHAAALDRIGALMGAKPGTPEGDELDVLADLVEHYEEKHVPMGYPSPVAALEFRMDQAGLAPRDLMPFIGTRAKVSEVLSGRRPLTMRMARALHEHLGIPAEVLLQQPGEPVVVSLKDLDWRKFPVNEMVKLGWIPKAAKSAATRAGKYIMDLIRSAGGNEVAVAALYRRNDHARTNAKSDSYALKAWCWRVLAVANQNRPKKAYVSGTVTTELLRDVARLSWSGDGPRLAKEFLAKHGIPLVIVPHLKRTYLDGAALKLGDGTPVVALTLRYDRLDNFWFCLLHELAHVGRHLESGEDTAFVDDLTLRRVDRSQVDVKEAEADEWAEEALIPKDLWETSAVRDRPTPMAVVQFANTLQIHPAIVAGRVRFERTNFRMLSHFVGSGEVRRQFVAAGRGD